MSGMLLVMLASYLRRKSGVSPQAGPGLLKQLVEFSAQSLVIAEQVALAKWDHGVSVEDPTREAQGISSAAKDGKARGLDPITVTNFFRAQTDANKLVQYLQQKILVLKGPLGDLNQATLPER